MTKENNFIPPSYEVPKTGGNYMKFHKGTNTFRILSDALLGYEYWNTDNKPIRSKEAPKELPKDIKRNEDGTPQPIKHFWAMIVWNYAEKKIQILEITQKTIQSDITKLAQNKKWGHPNGYDITVTREGDGLTTEYTVTPEPHSDIEKEVSDALASSQVKLEALYEGADPFSLTKVQDAGSKGYEYPKGNEESIPF